MNDIYRGLALESTVQAFSNIDIPKLQISALESAIEAFSNIDTYKLQTSLLESSIQTLSNIDISKLQMSVIESYNNYLNDIEDGTVLNLQYEEEKEIEHDILNICTDKNWQQSLAASFTKWKAKNPVIASIIIYILLPILIGIIVNSFSSGITSNSTKLKDTPSKDGVIINQININQEVTIVNECSYYYEIVIKTEGEQEMRGWMAKRNIVPMKNKQNFMLER